jgi:hypothetical protein
MKKIIFFNHFHNGDLFVSKEYVRDIISNLQNVNFEYQHSNHFKTILDLKIQSVELEKFLSPCDIIVEKEEKIYINTWLGCYKLKCHGLNELNFYSNAINFGVLHKIWNYIFSELNKRLNSNLILNNKDFYIGQIDYSMFELENIKIFLENNNKPRVLVCNNEPMAKQSFKGDLKNILEHLSLKYPSIDWICTNYFKSKNKNKNLFFTDDIIKSTKTNRNNLSPWTRSICDLNEISYLSNFCNLIVGKNSGPFVYTLTKENFKNTNITYISLNKIEEDSLFWNLNSSCKYIWSNNYNENNIISMIEKTINE